MRSTGRRLAGPLACGARRARALPPISGACPMARHLAVTAHFFRQRMALYGDLCLVRVAAGRVEGYLLGRVGRAVDTAGPCYARQPEAASPALREALADRAAGLPFAIAILETNRAAQD